VFAIYLGLTFKVVNSCNQFLCKGDLKERSIESGVKRCKLILSRGEQQQTTVRKKKPKS
jgi:hypothetical protein